MESGEMAIAEWTPFLILSLSQHAGILHVIQYINNILTPTCDFASPQLTSAGTVNEHQKFWWKHEKHVTCAYRFKYVHIVVQKYIHIVAIMEVSMHT